MTKYAALCAGSLLAMTVATSASAQAAGTPQATVATAPSAGASEAAPAKGLEEIVVTAQKRSENINRVGLTITALSSKTMEEKGIKNVVDLAAQVPGLTFTKSLNSAPVYSIRGVGFYETSLAAYPAVSIYVDQVPLPFPVLTEGVGLDLQSVEILKGPQGTLFGQNSTGGAINFIAAKPTQDFHAGFDLGYGRFNDATFSGFVSGPLSDTLTARLAVEGERADPWQHSYYLPVNGAKNGKVRELNGRLLVDWKPSDRLSAELTLKAGYDGTDPQAPQLIGLAIQNPSSPVNGPFLLSYPFAPKDARAADFTPGVPHRNNNIEQIAARFDYKLVGDLVLTSISSFIHFHRDEGISFGGTATDAYDIDEQSGGINSFTQELRVGNGSHGKLHYLAGVNYEHSVVDDDTPLTTFEGSTAFDTLHISGNPFLSDQTLNNYAAFASLDYEFLPGLTAKGGIRYTQSDRSAWNCARGGPPDGSVDALYNALTVALPHPVTQPFTPLQGNDCVSFDPVTNYPLKQGYFSKLDEHNVSWRVGLDYKPATDLLFYVNVSKGYKAGSIPAVTASTTIQYAPVKQESVLAYEGGFKWSLFDHTLSITGAGYHYDYTNKQIRSQIPQPIFGILNVLVNVPKSTVNGGEIALAWSPVQSLTLGVSANYNDGTITKYSGYSGAGIFANYADTPLPYTPKLTTQADIDYNFLTTAKYIFSAGASVSHKSSSVAVIGGDSIDRLDAYTLLDLRASVETADHRWRLQFIGKNVTNKYYWNNVVHAYDTIVRYTGMPATYQATVSYRF